jgi:hypothetical protein
MAQMRYPAFSPTAIFIIAWGNAPGIERATLSHIRFPRGDAPGYGVHGRWPIEPVAMFDGPMRYPVFSPKAILIIAWGNAPGIERATLSHIRFPRGDAPGYGVHGRWPIRPVVMFDGPNAIPGFFRQRRYSS